MDSRHCPEDANEHILAAIPILLTGRPEHELTAARQTVMAFLNTHLETARRIGWTDLELFGCHPDREAARNRYTRFGRGGVRAQHYRVASPATSAFGGLTDIRIGAFDFRS
jgi:hypothetical protein